MNCYAITLLHPVDSNRTSNFNFGVKAFTEDEALTKIRQAILPEDKDVLFCKYSKLCTKNCANCII